MSWWMTAIYDTCSLITLDKLLEERRTLSRNFPKKKVLALEVSLSIDQMHDEVAERIRDLVEICEPPPLTEIARILSSSALPKSLSDVDKLVFAAAIHNKVAVVTGDTRLAIAVLKRGRDAGNMAMILKELVVTNKLRPTVVESLIKNLANRNDCLLGIPNPKWSDLKDYTFPK